MNNLLRLIGRRLVALPIMALGVTVLVFFLMSFSKTDPAYTALGDSASPEAVAEYHEKYGLDDPWPVRYVRYMGDLIHGDMGTYGAARNSVAKRISTALPVTMQLTFIGLAIGAVVSFLLGVIAALYRDKWPDQVIRVFSIAGLATPSFWLAVLLILLFSSYLKVLPASGALPHFTTNPAGYLGRMIMPAIALAFPLTGQMTRIVRTAMVEELDKDYVRMARGAGVPEKVVVGINVLRNALITPVTTSVLRSVTSWAALSSSRLSSTSPAWAPRFCRAFRATRRTWFRASLSSLLLPSSSSTSWLTCSTCSSTRASGRCRLW